MHSFASALQFLKRKASLRLDTGYCTVIFNYLAINIITKTHGTSFIFRTSHGNTVVNGSNHRCDMQMTHACINESSWSVWSKHPETQNEYKQNKKHNIEN